MSSIGNFAAGGGVLAGGALLGLVAGNMRGPDVRGLIKQDMELLEGLPVEQVERRAELQRVIDIRIDDIITGVDKNRSLLEVAQSYRGNWRDIVVFIAAVLFTIMWATSVDPEKRPHYWPVLIVLILLSLLSAWYAGRGIWRALRSLIRAGRQGAHEKTE
jgi:hypothetical protein